MTKPTMAEQACMAMAEHERDWSDKIHPEDFIDGVRKIPIKRFEVEVIDLPEELLPKIHPNLNSENLWFSVFPDNSAFIWGPDETEKYKYFAVNGLSKQVQREIRTAVSGSKKRNRNLSARREIEAAVTRLRVELINLLLKQNKTTDADNTAQRLAQASIYDLLDSLTIWESSENFRKASYIGDFSGLYKAE